MVIRYLGVMLRNPENEVSSTFSKTGYRLQAVDCKPKSKPETASATFP